MSTAEIIVICVILAILMFVAINYFIHGRKLVKKEKAEKQKKNEVEVKTEEKVVEQKPVPVGIIREEKSKTEKEEFDLAPLKEQPKKEEKVADKNDNSKTLKQEIKNLSPEMKKVIMSDILKPRF